MIQFIQKLSFFSATLVSASLFFTTPAHAQTLKLGHVTPPSHVWHQVAERINQNVQEKSGGSMKVEVSPLSKLGSEAQMINLLQSGAMPIGVLTLGALTNRDDTLIGWSMPYLFDDVKHATQATQLEAAQQMLANLEAHGMIGVGYAFAGMRHVLSTKPVKAPSDLVGQKIRAFPSAIFNDWWTANGAAPTAMPLSEVAPSLTTNLLNAVDVDLDALVGMKFHQQAPYLTFTNHMAFPAVIVVSKRYWDRLDEDKQSLLLEAIKEAEEWGFERAIEADKENLAIAKADGAEVIEIDLTPFKEVGEQVNQHYLKDNELRAQFYEQVKALKQ
ncbi:tripartite ATP-independent transporter DctP family solute receptor [Paenalcaligenes hominis]|uniref:Tripartite ATP-independent transporter DctP family solute receptor n=1 Tax=Paenalcaligenes hominis TaxID=643674 RepID=A0ABX0WRB5_9BURK|nr:TRAP transporter substrate-binding protein [Paenalcaligenes hominis]NJB65303.1 tripartite ATP-independent transporter DctP family solute receptor [Paenalcaligenes hominis]GGE72565.1 hypothetical protein GCM10007278_21000 [Paenalcaligenes hominis]